MNLWQKIVTIRKDIDVFAKDGKGYGYEYVTGSQILQKIKQNMDELNVILSPKMGSHNTWIHEYTNKKGKLVKDFVIEAEGSYVWINADKPEEREEIPWKFFGQQGDISQAYGSGLTYSERYFLLKYFGIPTDEDDADARYAKDGNPSQNNNSTQNRTTTQRKEDLPLPANATEGSEIILSFGKYEGKTLREIFKENKGYLEWLVKNDKADNRIKTAINMMFQASQQSA
ncbi:ERF family protein [Bacillus tropicus]|uniref:ERF family protein n=1 Tax=Bacillus tropicus TaxID=2026188 RepID=UPI0011AA0E68|nr:ERF family protein [Bacillus tropicus]